MKPDIYLFASCCLIVGVIVGAGYYVEWWAWICIAANSFTAYQAMGRINSALARSQANIGEAGEISARIPQMSGQPE